MVKSRFRVKKTAGIPYVYKVLGEESLGALKKQPPEIVEKLPEKWRRWMKANEKAGETVK